MGRGRSPPTPSLGRNGATSRRAGWAPTCSPSRPSRTSAATRPRPPTASSTSAPPRAIASTCRRSTPTRTPPRTTPSASSAPPLQRRGRQLRYFQQAGDTFFAGDLNGDSTADFMVRVVGLHTLTAGNFVLQHASITNVFSGDWLARRRSETLEVAISSNGFRAELSAAIGSSGVGLSPLCGGVVAGGPGFEPRLTGSEPVVLPLNYPPAGAGSGPARMDLAAGDPVGKPGFSASERAWARKAPAGGSVPSHSWQTHPPRRFAAPQYSVTIVPRITRDRDGRGLHVTAGDKGGLAQRPVRAHFRCHRSRHQQLPAPGGARVGRRLRRHRRLFPAGPAGRGGGAERDAVRRRDRSHPRGAECLRRQDRAPSRQPRPPHRHRGLPPRLQRRGLPRPGQGAHRPVLRGHPAGRGGAAGARELREPARPGHSPCAADRYRRRLDRGELAAHRPRARPLRRPVDRADRHDVGAVGRRHPDRICVGGQPRGEPVDARLLRRHGRAHPRGPAAVLRQARHRRRDRRAARSR